MRSIVQLIVFYNQTWNDWCENEPEASLYTLDNAWWALVVLKTE